MSTAGKITTAIIIVAVIVAGAVFLSKDKKTTTNNSGGNQTGQNQADVTSNGGADVTISYDGNAFTLSATSMKAGGKVRVMNDSDKDLDFDSDPHPVHTDNPELNAGDIAPGDSKTFTVSTKGTWGFHNHLNSSQKGEIIIE